MRMGNRKIEVLFIGIICSKRCINEMLTLNIGRPNLASQKYHRLIIEGIQNSDNDLNIEVISIREYFINKSICKSVENENNVTYNYIHHSRFKFVNILLKYFLILIEFFKWYLKNKNKRKILFTDSLHVSSSFIAMLFSKLFNIELLTTVTDLPEYMYVFEKKKIIDTLVIKIRNIFIRNSDFIIVVTDKIWDKLKHVGAKKILIEGVVDVKYFENINKTRSKYKNKIIHYSGGLYEKFGIENLIKAFMNLKNDNIELHIFGIGELEKKIQDYVLIDFRIKFYGYQPNEIVLEDQQQSFLLVNPRFSCDEYTRYSFPSKNIEYMLSGVPFVANKLDGIPEEYYDNMFFFLDESVDGYYKTLEYLINEDDKILNQKALDAQNFVYFNKNNETQAYKIYNTIIS